MTTTTVAILAGGAGTRFWPASTARKPKQFLRLVGDETLLQQAFARAVAVAGAPRDVFVITSASFVELVREQLPALPRDNVVGEPARKDTAAAAVLATLLAHARALDNDEPGGVVALLTSDHVIAPLASFVETLASAAAAARAADDLVTIGIVPSYPATGYGYLEVDGAAPTAPAATTTLAVRRFVEKPDLARAQQYLAGGRHLWNSGMFVWRTDVALAQMRAHLPVHVEALGAAVAAGTTSSALADAFSRVPKISIDYGLMEKAARVACVPARFSWSDVGSFPALADHLPKDAHGNAARARLAVHDARGNVVWAEDAGELVALVGVDGLVVVRAGARTLVTTAARAEETKKLVERLAPSDVD